MFLNKIICKKEISSKEIERNSFNSIIVNSYSCRLIYWYLLILNTENDICSCMNERAN